MVDKLELGGVQSSSSMEEQKVPAESLTSELNFIPSTIPKILAPRSLEYLHGRLPKQDYEDGKGNPEKMLEEVKRNFGK